MISADYGLVSGFFVSLGHIAGSLQLIFYRRLPFNRLKLHFAKKLLLAMEYIVLALSSVLPTCANVKIDPTLEQRSKQYFGIDRPQRRSYDEDRQRCNLHDHALSS